MQRGGAGEKRAHAICRAPPNLNPVRCKSRERETGGKDHPAKPRALGGIILQDCFSKTGSTSAGTQTSLITYLSTDKEEKKKKRERKRLYEQLKFTPRLLITEYGRTKGRIQMYIYMFAVYIS